MTVYTFVYIASVIRPFLYPDEHVWLFLGKSGKKWKKVVKNRKTT